MYVINIYFLLVYEHYFMKDKSMALHLDFTTETLRTLLLIFCIFILLLG